MILNCAQGLLQPTIVILQSHFLSHFIEEHLDNLGSELYLITIFILELKL